MENTLSMLDPLPAKLKLFICEHFKSETIMVLENLKASDVEISCFPARCSHPALARERLADLAVFTQTGNDDKMICRCSCLANSDHEFLDKQDFLKLDQSSCFEMMTSPEYVKKQISEGAYIITPGWLSNWKKWAAQWGSPEVAREMFSETIDHLLVLDTGVNPDTQSQFAAFSEYVDRQGEIVFVGLDYYQNLLENKILHWRLSNMQANSQGERSNNTNSDYAMALDLMTNLVNPTHERHVARQIMELLAMLFAAEKRYYVSLGDSGSDTVWSDPPDLKTEGVLERLTQCEDEIRTSASGRGFCMSVFANKERIAVVEIDELHFPEKRNQYKNLALALSGVFALSIENSRFFQNIKQMNESLHELNATKDKFFSIVAHDLRSPLANVIQFCDLLLEFLKAEDYSKVEQIAEITQKTAKNSMALLVNILEWARSQSGRIEFNPTQVQLHDLVDESIVLLSEGANQKSIQLVNTTPDGQEIVADKKMLNTVFRNILSNAIKFTSPGGEVKIESEIKNGVCQVAISDNGAGIPEQNITKIFSLEDAVSTSGTQGEQGTGLGLILCKEFVEKHGGQIWVESKEDQGSTFFFTIPEPPPKKAFKGKDDRSGP